MSAFVDGKLTKKNNEVYYRILTVGLEDKERQKISLTAWSKQIDATSIEKM